jgi:EAL domain-containing protein (putative c-di-GMP-specific phosphodiesterase class I)
VPLRITMCAGVAAAGGDAPTIDSMLRDADDALIRAKADGPGLVRVHSGGASERSQERLHRRTEIRAAFEAGGKDFLVYYQPIVRIEDQSVFAVEALVRWRHEGSVLPPGAFIQDLVQSGSMAALTKHMLATSLRELRDAGLDFAVTVNVPPELISDELIAQTTAAVRSTGSSNEQLILEITEESLMRSPETAARILNDLRSHGIRVELDDFGTGWSGLSSLRDLAVDGLKIDFSFVSRMITDSTARAIVHGVSAVASDLGILVIYEGVEDREVEELLRAEYAGCLQGYGIGRPMPIEDLVRWVELRAT